MRQLARKISAVVTCLWIGIAGAQANYPEKPITAINAHLALGYLMTGKVPQRQGNNNPITAPSEVFRAADGYFSMSAANLGQFANLLQAPELDAKLDQGPRFASPGRRVTGTHGLSG